MRKKVRTIKLCVNCCHLHVVGEGQEIDGLEETAYLETYCDIFNQSMRELYQFPIEEGPIVLEKSIYNEDCPFWTPWDLSQKMIDNSESEKEDADVDASE